MGENKSGFLVKEGAVWKTWKKRLFVLKNEELCYSKSQDSGKLGAIDMGGVGKILAVEYKKKRCCFAIETTKRTYYICAPDEQTRDAWIAVLCDERDRIQERGKYAKAPPSPRPGQPATEPPPSPRPSAKTTARVKASEKVTLDDFVLLKVIGKGSFGKVFMARKKDNGKIYALKVLRKKVILEKKELQHTITEKNVLQRLVHPFLVNMYFHFQTADKVCFVMDFINGGELFSHLQTTRRLPEFYAAEIILGLEYLHSNGVIYRDLKPENLLVTEDGHICMTDFGIAKEGLLASDDRTRTFCGTPEYLAPEVCRGEPYGKAVDWWSLGTLIYEMLAGNPPFYSHNVQAMYRAIMSEDPFWPDWLSPVALSICKELLQRNPEKRLRDPKMIKTHPFFHGVDWERLLEKEVSPPYVPPVKGKEDVSMISHEFLDLKLELTPTDPSELTDAVQKDFKAFDS